MGRLHLQCSFQMSPGISALRPGSIPLYSCRYRVKEYPTRVESTPQERPVAVAPSQGRHHRATSSAAILRGAAARRLPRKQFSAPCGWSDCIYQPVRETSDSSSTAAPLSPGASHEIRPAAPACYPPSPKNWWKSQMQTNRRPVWERLIVSNICCPNQLTKRPANSRPGLSHCCADCPWQTMPMPRIKLNRQSRPHTMRSAVRATWSWCCSLG